MSQCCFFFWYGESRVYTSNQQNLRPMLGITHLLRASLWIRKKLNLKSACFCYWWNWIAGTFANRSDGNAKYGVQRLLCNLATHLNLFSGIRNSGQKYGEQQRHRLSAAVRCSLSERHMPALHDVTVSLDMQIFDGSSTRQSSQVPAGISRRDQSRMQLWNRFELLPKKTKTFLEMNVLCCIAVTQTVHRFLCCLANG